MEAARAALQPVAEGAQLRVAIDQGFGRLLVAPLVPRFLERFPQVTLRLINAEEVTDGAAFDVELRSDGRVAAGEVANSLGTPPMILCAAPNYLGSRALPQSPSELAKHAMLWAAAGPDSVLRLAKDGGAVTVPGTPRLVAQDLTALHAAVAAGLGMARCPSSCAAMGLAMKRLVRLLPDWEVADPVELTAVSPADRPQSRPCAASWTSSRPTSCRRWRVRQRRRKRSRPCARPADVPVAAARDPLCHA